MAVGGGKIEGMEKQPHQEYRDELAKELKQLRSNSTEGVEDSKLLLDLEGGTPEYKEAKRLHLIDIQEKIKEDDEREKREAGEKALREAIEKHETGVEKMLEIIKDLPLEYIKVPVALNKRDGQGTVLLKIKGTDYAYLVSDDLQKCGSDFGIKTGGEKIFIFCGCSNCRNFSTEGFAESVFKTAKENGIDRDHIIARYVNTLPDAEYFNPEKSLPKEAADELVEKDLLPTRSSSENVIKKYKEEQLKREQTRAGEETKEKLEKEKQKRILEECYSLEDKIVEGDPGATVRLEEIIKNSNEILRQIIIENIEKRIYSGDIKNIEKIPSNINVLCVSEFEPRVPYGVNFHLKSKKEIVDLERVEGGSVVFEYPYAGWDQKYRVVGIRSGLNGSALVVQSTPNKNMEYKSRKETDTLELYTDIPILKLFSTPVEDKILSKISPWYNMTSEEIRRLAEKELADKNR